MKIGILYICTGKYKIFWKDFYLSCEKNFITEAEKHYFVFTDSPEIYFESDNKNIHRIYQANLGWPDNTLKRYEVFLKAKEKVFGMDYLFFLNANLLFLERITAEEFLPHNQEKFVGCLHPGYYNKPIEKFTYENNPKSKAYLSKEVGKHYFAGGINGGVTKNFLEVSELLDKNIETDKTNKILAIWHDESHWNAYLNTHLDAVKTLPPDYLYPEGENMPFDKKILIRDKKLIGGHTDFRNKIELRLVFNKLKSLVKKVLIKFGIKI